MSLVMIDQYLHVVEQSIYISYMPSKKEIIKELSTFFLYRKNLFPTEVIPEKSCTVYTGEQTLECELV